MKEALQAVRQAFLAVLAGCAIAVVLAIPSPQDGKIDRAFKELCAFQSRFDARARQRAIENEALQKAGVTLAQIAEKVEGPGVKDVDARGSKQKFPLQTRVNLGTLQAIKALSAAGATVKVTGPDIEQIAQSLRWRLARWGKAKRYILLDLVWTAGGADKTELDVERQVESARLDALEKRRAFAKAERARVHAQKTLDFRRKRRASRKRIRKAWQKREQTLAEATERKEALEQARQRYRELADRAGSFPAEDEAKKQRAGPGMGVVVATLKPVPGRDRISFRFPVATGNRAVPVTPVAAPNLETVEAAGLWPAVKDQSLARAIAAVQGRFSWHYLGFDIAGFRLGAPTVLQLLPLILAALLWYLVGRCRRARSRYSPFHSKASELVRIGLGSNLLDTAALVGLPFLASALSVWSLALVDAAAVLGALSGLVAIGTAVWCSREMIALHDLCADIERTSIAN